MKNTLRIFSFIVMSCMFTTAVHAQKDLIPIPSETLLQHIYYVYLGLDDGGTGTYTHYIFDRCAGTGTAGSTTNNPPYLYGDSALHYNCYPRYGVFGFAALKRSYCLAPTSTTGSAYEAKTSLYQVYLDSLNTSTPEKARFTICAYVSGKPYYLSRTKNTVKWYNKPPKDQIAEGEWVSKIDTASAWTFYILPSTATDNITTTFDCGSHGSIEGESTCQYKKVTGIPWPTIVTDEDQAFIGWYDNTACTGDEYITHHSVLNKYYLPSSSTTLHAKYLPAMTDSIRLLSWNTNFVRILYTGKNGKRICVRHATDTQDSGNLVTGEYTTSDTTDLSTFETDYCIYDIPVANLKGMAGQRLLLTFYNTQNEPISFVRYTVPNIFDGAVTESSITTGEVVLLNGAVLTIYDDMSLNAITISGGAKLVVSKDISLQINRRLTLRGGDYLNKHYSFVYPQMVVNGSVRTPNDSIYYEYLLNSDQYYGLALPFNVQTSQITYADGTPATYGLQIYNGQKRATTGTGWETVSPATLQRGIGYVIYAMPQQIDGIYQNYARLRFPMKTTLRQGEGTGSSLPYAKVPVTPHGYGQASTRVNDEGWNFVANPYLANFSDPMGMDGSNQVGLLELDANGYHWIGTDRYVVMPNRDGSSYLPHQKARASLVAFQPFFVQAGTGDSLCFALANRTQHITPRRADQVGESADLPEQLGPQQVKARKAIPSGNFPYWDLDKANCTTGSVDNPFQTQFNKVDFGYNDSRSRHTVHYVDELDSCTGYQLHTLLPDGRPSVRLGNIDWGRSSLYSGGECIQYEYQVTPDNPILILYYAAVLQVPGHKAGKPHFKMEIFEKKHYYGNYYYYSPLGNDCFSFDFTKGEGIDDWNCGSWCHRFLGKTQSNDSVCWKDWTAMSINLQNYVNKTLYIRLSTQDCDEYGHFGYAYFGLDLAKCEVQIEACGTSDEQSTFAAPEYFAYEWYKTAQPGVVISTERTIDVPNDGTEYACKVMNIENNECYFTIKRAAIPRVPIAAFDTIHYRGECIDTLILINKSYVSSTYEGLDVLPDTCETAKWTIVDPWGNESIYTTLNPDTIFLIPGGDYTVSLVAGITEGRCESEVKEKFLFVPAGKQIVYFDDTICQGDYIEHGIIRHTEAGNYIDTVPSGLSGCHDTLIYIGTLTVNPVNQMPVEERVICKGDFTIWNGVPYTEPGTYYDTLVNQYGCDSITTLHLRIAINGIVQGNTLSSSNTLPRRLTAPTAPHCWADPYPLFIDSIVVCNTPSYTWHDSSYAKPGDYHKTLINHYGCDSLAFLHLEFQGVRDTDSLFVCYQDLPYMWRGQELASNGFYYDTTYDDTPEHCFDSLLTFYLTISAQPIENITDTAICLGDTITWETWREWRVWRDSTYFDTIQGTNGCDSAYWQLRLHIKMPSDSVTTTYVCYGDSLLWYDHFYYQTIDDTLHLTNAVGCDSLCVLNLFVPNEPITEILVDTQLCIGDSLYINDTTYRTTSLDTIVFYNTLGCDSAYHVIDVRFELCCDTLRTTFEPVQACAEDDSAFVGLVNREGRIYTYQLAFDTKGHLNGFRDTLITLADTFPSALAIPIPHGTEKTDYVRPDNYNYTLTLQGMCDNQIVHQGSMLIMYPSWLITQRWSNVLAILNEHYNGGYVFSNIRWFRGNQLVEGERPDESYLYELPHLTYTDEYWAELTRMDDGQTIRTCSFIPSEQSDSTIVKDITLEKVSGHRNLVEIKTNISGTYRLYTIEGTQVRQGTFAPSTLFPATQIELPLQAGVYIVVCDGNEGTHKIFKLSKD